MKKPTTLKSIGILALLTLSLLFIADGQAFAQKKDYQPGEKIEYMSSSYPETWEEGTFVEATPGGSQPIILEKPNRFYKDGYQRAATWEKIRPLSAKTAPKTPAAKINITPQSTKSFGTGLMTQAQVISFLQAKMGDKPYENPRREEIKKELAEMVKRRGLNFRYSASTSDFYNKLNKYGANTSDISFPLRDNYGAPTKQSWLMGAWQLGKIGVAVDYIKNNRVYRQGEIGVANIGTLALKANGTYTWKSTTAKATSGKWRKATPAEMQSKGGDGIVLLKAKSNYNWLVTKDRVTTLKGAWINISELETRQINEYGSRR